MDYNQTKWLVNMNRKEHREVHDLPLGDLGIGNDLMMEKAQLQ